MTPPDLARLATLLSANRLDELAAAYSFPLPLQLQSQLMLLPDAAALAHCLQAFRRAMADQGMAGLRPELVAQDIPRRGRMRLWVDWHYLDAAGKRCATSTAIYYCAAHGAATRIEMVQYLTLSLPAMLDYQPLTAAA